MVDIFTTDGINFSAKSANELGTAFKLVKMLKFKINNNKDIFLIIALTFVYQIIKKPITKKIVPIDLNLFSGIFLIISSIFLILDSENGN